MIAKGSEFFPYYIQTLIKCNGGYGFEQYRKGGAT